MASEVSIYIKRDDLILGPFSETQTVARYRRGEFRESDLAMIDGMTGWHPLATYLVDEEENAAPTFSTAAPPPIPTTPPPRFDMGEEPHPEPAISAQHRPPGHVNPVGIAWMLLGGCVLAMFLSRWPWTLWIPPLLGAVALAVQQLVRRNFINAGPLLAVALLMPWFVWSQWLSPTKHGAVASAHSASPEAPAATPVPAPVPLTQVPEPPETAENTAPAPAPAPESPPPLPMYKGDRVALLHDTKLLFNGKEFRLGAEGEEFEVLDAKPDKIFLRTLDARGRIIAVTAKPTDLRILPPQVAEPTVAQEPSSRPSNAPTIAP